MDFVKDADPEQRPLQENASNSDLEEGALFVQGSFGKDSETASWLAAGSLMIESPPRGLCGEFEGIMAE